MNTWIRNRQMGEAEAVYRLAKEFHFRESDAKCVYVATCPRSQRSKFLINATDKPEFKNTPKVSVDNKNNNVYVEKYDTNSKYERRPKEEMPVLSDLSFSQMAKIFSPSWGTKKNMIKDIYDENEIRQ